MRAFLQEFRVACDVERDVHAALVEFFQDSGLDLLRGADRDGGLGRGKPSATLSSGASHAGPATPRLNSSWECQQLLTKWSMHLFFLIIFIILWAEKIFFFVLTLCVKLKSYFSKRE